MKYSIKVCSVFQEEEEEENETKQRGKENKKAGEKSKVKWSNEKIFQLIKLYEERPCFWEMCFHNITTTERQQAKRSLR